MNVNDTYHNTCNDQPSTWTIEAMEDGKVTVYSPQSQGRYTVSQVIFEDTMRHLGFTLQADGPAKYRVYYINHQYYSDYDFDFINRAIEYGKETGMEFRVELGSMICCAWDAITGLRFYAEYQLWRQEQEYMLAKIQGE